MPRLLEEIYPAWDQSPPLHRSTAAVLGAFGVKRRSSAAPTKPEPAEESVDLLRDIAGAGVVAAPALPPELLALIP